MYEMVDVKKVLSDGTVLVSCDVNACSGCKSNGFCNTKGRTFKALNDKNLPIKDGDMVSLYLKPSRTIASVFITLMVPLACFPLFFLLFQRFGDKIAMLAGFGGMAAAFALVALYFRATEKKYMPTVSEILA